jgi:hypothetical protein
VLSRWQLKDSGLHTTPWSRNVENLRCRKGISISKHTLQFSPPRAIPLSSFRIVVEFSRLITGAAHARLHTMFSPNAHQESQITTVPAAVLTSDHKHGYSLSEKQDVILSENEGFEVEVSTAVGDRPSGSRRERYARFLRSLMTKQTLMNIGEVLWKFGKLTGPGAIISVAYIDPDNYQTSVSSGAQFKFKLLFMILFSNIVAVYLQVSLIVSERLYPGMT